MFCLAALASCIVGVPLAPTRLAYSADAARPRLAALKDVLFVAHVDKWLTARADPRFLGPTSPYYLGGYAREAMALRALYRPALTPDTERKYPHQTYDWLIDHPLMTLDVEEITGPSVPKGKRRFDFAVKVELGVPRRGLPTSAKKGPVDVVYRASTRIDVDGVYDKGFYPAMLRKDHDYRGESPYVTELKAMKTGVARVIEGFTARMLASGNPLWERPRGFDYPPLRLPLGSTKGWIDGPALRLLGNSPPIGPHR